MEIITALGAIALGAVLAGVGQKNKLLRVELEAWIDDLHQQAQAKFRALIAEIEKRGYEVAIQSGYRSFEKQAQLYASGQTPARAGASFHNYGLALDINMAKNGQVWRMASGRAAWLATGIPQIAEQMGFTWGGRFGGYYAANGDNVHFHLPIATTAELYQLARNQNVEGNKVQIAAIGAIYTNKKKGARECIDGRFSDAAQGACSYHGGLIETLTKFSTKDGEIFWKALYKLRFEGGKNMTKEETAMHNTYKKEMDELVNSRVYMQNWDTYLPPRLHTKESIAIQTLVAKIRFHKVTLEDIQKKYAETAKKMNLNNLERQLIQTKYLVYRIFAIAESK